jgi:stalled ribosome rescue protein Dom34
MEKDVALWIDHRQAVLAVVTGETDDLRRIESGLEKHVRFSGGEGNPEDARERQFETHLNHYYDKVVASLRDARSILIMGPGEAKGELEKRLRDAGLGKAIVGVETADKMTDPQIAATARQRFRS